MFEFITISNGVAVVQHVPSGSVYRFRPVRPGEWNALSPLGISGAMSPGGSFDILVEEARTFAEMNAPAMVDAAKPRPIEHATKDQPRWGLRSFLKRAAG